jgi:hypothetical protein
LEDGSSGQKLSLAQEKFYRNFQSFHLVRIQGKDRIRRTPTHCEQRCVIEMPEPGASGYHWSIQQPTIGGQSKGYDNNPFLATLLGYRRVTLGRIYTCSDGIEITGQCGLSPRPLPALPAPG